MVDPAERRAVVAFGVTVLAAIGLAVVYLRGGQPQLEGSLLATAFAGLCVGFVTWANKLLPQGPAVESRHELQSSEAEREEVEESFERGGGIERRSLLLKALGAALGSLGLAALFPIRSLGPSPGNSLEVTPWRRGLRLVNERGAPVRVDQVPLGGLVTVFPEGHVGSADGQAVLMRVEPALLQPRPGRESWAPNGYVAYSKVCTHAGCPVGLYDAQDHQLLCPCHQSTFDVLRGAKPTFGPAAAALPQLPLFIDRDGVLRAQSDFTEPVGPSFWKRQRAPASPRRAWVGLPWPERDSQRAPASPRRAWVGLPWPERGSQRAPASPRRAWRPGPPWPERGKE